MDKKGINKTGVKNLFNNISGRYDLTNVFISLGIVKYWRKRFSDEILGKKRQFLMHAVEPVFQHHSFKRN